MSTPKKKKIKPKSRAKKNEAKRLKKDNRGRKDIASIGKRFTAAYQPSGQAKSLGKAIKKYNRELVKEIRDMPYNLSLHPRIKLQLEKGFGIDTSEWSSFAIGQFRLQQKHILFPSESIFNSILNQTEGMPKQPTELSGEITVTPGIVVNFKDAE